MSIIRATKDIGIISIIIGGIFLNVLLLDKHPVIAIFCSLGIGLALCMLIFLKAKGEKNDKKEW